MLDILKILLINKINNYKILMLNFKDFKIKFKIINYFNKEEDNKFKIFYKRNK